MSNYSPMSAIDVLPSKPTKVNFVDNYPDFQDEGDEREIVLGDGNWILLSPLDNGNVLLSVDGKNLQFLGENLSLLIKKENVHEITKALALSSTSNIKDLLLVLIRKNCISEESFYIVKKVLSTYSTDYDEIEIDFEKVLSGLDMLVQLEDSDFLRIALESDGRVTLTLSVVNEYTINLNTFGKGFARSVADWIAGMQNKLTTWDVLTYLQFNKLLPAEDSIGDIYQKLLGESSVTRHELAIEEA